MMTKDQAWKLNTAYYAEHFLKIKNKNSEIVPLKFNSSQLKLDKLISDLKKEKKPIFIIILKARQIGFSTYTESKIFHETVTSDNVNALIIAHKEDAASNLFSMSKLFYDMLPAPMKPVVKASNSKELIFDKDGGGGLRSKIKIQSARDVEGARSATYNLLHISELDFWNDPATAMTALLQTVPINEKTLVIIESTANGWGGYLHKLWQDAKQGKNQYVPFFVAWYNHEEYKMPVDTEFKSLDNHPVYGNETQLKTTYNLTNEQLAWRRWTIANKCNNDINVFRQEYPANDHEAFLTSGRSRFNTEILSEYQSRALTPMAKGNFVRLQDKDYKIIDTGKKFIEVYKKKEVRKQYMIVADVAEGLEHGDYSCAKIFDLITWEQVAEWHGHIEHALFGKVLVDLGRIYNNAVLVVESNNHGHSVITQIKNEKYPITQIFIGNFIGVKGDDDFKDPEKIFGWSTTSKTKKAIIDNLAYLISKKEIKGFNKQDVEELFSYVLDDQGKTNAMQGSFDDRVMALAIGYYLLNNDLFRSYYIKRGIKEWERCENCQRRKSMDCLISDKLITFDDVCSQYRARKELYG